MNIQEITSDPRWANATSDQRKQLISLASDAPPGLKDYMGVAKQAVSDAAMEPGTITRKMVSDPVVQAKALPALTGTLGALSPVPMGATIGTVGGRQLSNAALKAYGKQEEIPSTTSQVMEGAGAAMGDLTAIPAINKMRYGSEIGAVEKAAGVPASENISTTPMALGQKTIGEFINDAVDSVKGVSGSDASPTYWKQIKDQVDRIYKLGKDQAITGLDQGRLKWLNAMVQNGLNKAVPGRAAPAAALALSQKVPNLISSANDAIPWWAKGAASVVGGDALVNALGSRKHQ